MNTTTGWYEMSPSKVEAGKRPTRHVPMELSHEWQDRWTTGFVTQMGKLLKLIQDTKLGEGGPHKTEWVLFLATELATWLELLVDLMPQDADHTELSAAFQIWGVRHASLPVHSPRLARLMAELREEHWRASRQGK